MRLLLASAATALLIAGSAYAHEGKDKKRDVVAEYDFSGFDSIEVEGVYELDIRLGNEFSVRTEASDDDADWRNVTLEGDTLVLGTKKRERTSRWNNHNHSDGVYAVITMPRLVDLDVAGVATGKVSAFDGGDIKVDIAGVSNLTLSGACDQLDIDMAGVGDVDASELKCEEVEADLGGVGELSVYASKRIEADAGGMGQIEVYGNPEEQDTNGGFMSKVRIKS